MASFLRIKYSKFDFGNGSRSQYNFQIMEITMSRLDDIKGIITGMEDDMVKFYEKGNKAAGTRARKSLQNLKKLSQEIRLEIQDIKNKG